MRFDPRIPPRPFVVGRDNGCTMTDCGSLYLQSDEQVTFVTPGAPNTTSHARNGDSTPRRRQWPPPFVRIAAVLTVNRTTGRYLSCWWNVATKQLFSAISTARSARSSHGWIRVKPSNESEPDRERIVSDGRHAMETPPTIRCHCNGSRLEPLSRISARRQEKPAFLWTVRATVAISSGAGCAVTGSDASISPWRGSIPRIT